MRIKFFSPVLFSCLLIIILFQSERPVNKERITIIDPRGKQVIEYGVQELSTILKDKFDVRVSGNASHDGWNIMLKVDPGMKPFSFSVKQPETGKYRTIYLSGHDETCVLHAIYTMMEVMGYTFDLTGIRRPENPSIQSLTGYSRVIYPVVERRGIRQHINFLMDISSYPLAEAKEYIKNLARLRMNYITFHSYPGQWYSYGYQGTQQLAGSFFYGEQDLIPKDSSVRKFIRNDSFYCIPEIEPFWNDHEKRSQMAIKWLNGVMAESKRVGMTVRFSYELRTPGIDFARTTSEAILKEYPLIDEMEFITEEDVPGYLDEVTNDVSCAKALRDTLRKRNVRLSTGIYNTTQDELKKGFDLLRNITPPDMKLTVLPAHGARMADKNLLGIPFTKEDINRTMIYSWIQLDGMMYLQQNPVEGISALIADNLRINDNKPLYGICWNHWQNYENRTAARYAAEAMIDGPKPIRKFYDSLAERLGIGDSATYASAMEKLDETDDYCRQNIVTIGFCPKIYWSKNNKGISHYGRYKKDKLLSAVDQYTETKNEVHSCIKSVRNKDSKTDLQFLENRIACSIFYLKAFVAMSELEPLFKKSHVLSHQDSAMVVQQSKVALAYENSYLQTFSKFILDRGCEGTLESFYSVPLQALKNIIYRYENKKTDNSFDDQQFDEPPAPK